MVQITTKAKFTMLGLHNECCYLAFNKTCVLKDDYSDQFAGRFKVKEMDRTENKLKDLNKRRQNPNEAEPSDRHPILYDQKFGYLKDEYLSEPSNRRNRQMEVNNYLPCVCTLCKEDYMKDTNLTIVTSCFPCYEEQKKQVIDKLGKEKIQEKLSKEPKKKRRTSRRGLP